MTNNQKTTKETILVVLEADVGRWEGGRRGLMTGAKKIVEFFFRRKGIAKNKQAKQQQQHKDYVNQNCFLDIK